MNKVDLLRYSRAHKLFKPFYSGRGHVILLHRVAYDNDTWFHRSLQVTPEYLESVIKYFISKKIDIITLDECYDRITTKGKVNRFVVFTFDDGYLDNLTNALPVFEKYNAPFAVFLASGYPDNKLFFWGYLLEDLVKNNDEVSFNDGMDSFVYKTRTRLEKRDAYYSIKKYLRSSDKDSLLSRLKAVLGVDHQTLLEETNKLMLSWEQVQLLSDHPLVTIGAHTVSHSPLSLLDEKDVIGEINESVETIEKRIGKKVAYLAYPFGGDGEASQREYEIAKECHMRMAFTAKLDNVSRKHARKLTSLPRISLDENWSTAHIDLFINGFSAFLYKYKKRLKDCPWFITLFII